MLFLSLIVLCALNIVHSADPSAPDARNCKELLQQGKTASDWYDIYPDGPDEETSMFAYCDMETDGGGWLVFQRRHDGIEDFSRDWNSYKNGFGDDVEFWLGNDNLHRLTSSGTWELRIDLVAFDNIEHYAKYASFKILGEADKYKLILGAYTDGDAGDSLTHHANMPFSTKDKESTNRCVRMYKGGWWYNNNINEICYNANLNGLYHRGAHNSDGIIWRTGKGPAYSYKVSEMKIRPI